MSNVISQLSISLDGFVAGPNQSTQDPIGEGGLRLHEWAFATRAWRGWWGADPPYHAPVFVLTHHEREPLEMEGGTRFEFVTGGVAVALGQAQAAAGDGDVMVAGGA
jgi:hypothetical protein